MAKKKKESHGMLPLAAGVIAGVAGMYFLHGQGKAPKANRQKIKGWVLKAKGEALEKIEKMKELDEEAYHAIIDGVMAKYNKLDSSDREEIEALAKDMKKHWKAIAREITNKKKPAVKGKKPTSAPVASTGPESTTAV